MNANSTKTILQFVKANWKWLFVAFKNGRQESFRDIFLKKRPKGEKANVSKRACRYEFWGFFVISVIGWFVLFPLLGKIETLLMADMLNDWRSMGPMGSEMASKWSSKSISALICFFVFTIPFIRVSIRRLHDIGKSGILVIASVIIATVSVLCSTCVNITLGGLLGLAVFLLQLWLFWLATQKGDEGANVYGDPPVGASEERVDMPSKWRIVTVVGVGVVFVLFGLLLSKIGVNPAAQNDVKQHQEFKVPKLEGLFGRKLGEEVPISDNEIVLPNGMRFLQYEPEKKFLDFDFYAVHVLPNSRRTSHIIASKSFTDTTAAEECFNNVCQLLEKKFDNEMSDYTYLAKAAIENNGEAGTAIVKAATMKFFSTSLIEVDWKVKVDWKQNAEYQIIIDAMDLSLVYIAEQEKNEFEVKQNGKRASEALDAL